MTTTTATIATTPTAQEPAPRKALENEIKFSWRSVMRRWGQNLKDDIDPALTGAKMALYVHAVPTWHREYSDGKMRSNHGLITGISALIVGGTQAAMYYAGSQVAEQKIGSVDIPHLGPVPHLGYVAVGAALIAANTVSWGYEAFRRAKKTENSNVVMARIERAMEKPAPAGEYDLSLTRMKDALAQELVSAEEKKMRKEIASHRLDRDDTSELEQQLIMNLQQYRVKIDDHVREAILDAAYGVFGGLVADNQLGSKYEMTVDLHAGPTKRKIERRREEGCKNNQLVNVTALSELIKQTVKDKGGAANIELFGTMTALYGGKDRQHTGYHVVPNKNVWK